MCFGRGLIGIAHPEIDDVLASGAGLGLEVVDDGEDVGGEPLDPVEVVHENLAQNHTLIEPKLSTNREDGTRLFPSPRPRGDERFRVDTP